MSEIPALTCLSCKKAIQNVKFNSPKGWIVESELYNGAVEFHGRAHYGSSFDTAIFKVLICDDCLSS